MNWDLDQRLESVTQAGQDHTEFVYDADGARVRRSSGDVFTYYPAGGTEYVFDVAAGSGEFSHYHSFNGAMVAFTTGGDTTWMFTDQISSTSLTHSEAGVNKIQRYTPWGETRTDGGLATDHTYTGQIEDRSTGLGLQRQMPRPVEDLAGPSVCLEGSGGSGSVIGGGVCFPATNTYPIFDPSVASIELNAGVGIYEPTAAGVYRTTTYVEIATVEQVHDLMTTDYRQEVEDGITAVAKCYFRSSC